LQAMTERVRADAAAFDIDADDYLGWVWTDVEGFGKRIGLLKAHADDGDDPPSLTSTATTTDGGPPSPPRQSSPPIENTEPFAARCFGCLLTLICARKLVPA